MWLGFGDILSEYHFIFHVFVVFFSKVSIHYVADLQNKYLQGSGFLCFSDSPSVYLPSRGIILKEGPYMYM